MVELGGGDVVLTADLPASAPGDGAATVGEALWVQGANFGRRPTVSVAGHPGVVLARTADGGLVTRVPPGTPAGRQALKVTNDHGSGELPLTVRRLVAAIPAGGGHLALASLDPGADGPRAAGSVPAAGPLLQVGADGRAAYLLDAASGHLSVFELPAQAQPRPVAARGPEAKAAAHAVLGFAAAAHAPTLMIARAEDLLILDTTTPLRPVRARPRVWPAEVAKAGMVRAALSPDGRGVAVGTEDNRLVLLDVGTPGAVAVRAALDVAPGARVPIIADVAFAPDGRTVWLALGDTTKSLAVGPQPTEIVAVRVTPGASPQLAVARRVTVTEAARPKRLSAGRARPLQSGASIRLPPERATVYLTAVRQGAGAAVFRLGAEDQATVALEAPPGAQLGGAELTPDGAWLLAPMTSARGALSLMTVAADGRTATPVPVSVDLGVTGSPAGKDLPSLAIQP